MSVSVPTRDGATVMLVRDGDHADRPLEVFMLRRHPRTAFGSVHVFPGGVVDPSDHDPALAGRGVGRSDDEASALLGVGRGGLASWIAAARECFEEAGVLLARTADGVPLRVDHDPVLEARFAGHRAALHSGRRSLLDILEQEDLVLGLDDVHYVAHWITPEGEPKRYDTRFFLARAPEGQAYAHDDGELTHSEWVRPAEALARQQAGDFAMIFPTISSIDDIGRFATTDELMATHPRAAAGAHRGT